MKSWLLQVNFFWLAHSWKIQKLTFINLQNVYMYFLPVYFTHNISRSQVGFTLYVPFGYLIIPIIFPIHVHLQVMRSPFRALYGLLDASSHLTEACRHTMSVPSLSYPIASSIHRCIVNATFSLFTATGALNEIGLRILREWLNAN